jgi:hypothetical protein
VVAGFGEEEDEAGVSDFKSMKEKENLEYM